MLRLKVPDDQDIEKEELPSLVQKPKIPGTNIPDRGIRSRDGRGAEFMIYTKPSIGILKSSILMLSAIMMILPKGASAKDYYIAVHSVEPVKESQAEVCDDKLPECNIYLALDDKNIIHVRAHFSEGGVEFRFVLGETGKLSANQQDYFYFPIGNEGTFERDVSLFVPHPQAENDSRGGLLVERISNLKVADLKIFIKTGSSKK